MNTQDGYDEADIAFADAAYKAAEKAAAAFAKALDAAVTAQAEHDKAQAKFEKAGVAFDKAIDAARAVYAGEGRQND